MSIKFAYATTENTQTAMTNVGSQSESIISKALGMGADFPYKEYIGAGIGLIVVLIILLILAQVIRSVRLNPAGRWNKRLKIVDQVLIGNKERLALVEVDGEAVLIGITPTHISFLNKTGDYNHRSALSSANDVPQKMMKKEKVNQTLEDENWMPMTANAPEETNDDPDIVSRQRIKLRPKKVEPTGDTRQEPRL